MGVAYFISLERPVPGVSASSVSGKGLARAEWQLMRLCNRLEVKNLFLFMSSNRGASRDLDDVGDVMANAARELNALRAKRGLPPSGKFASPDKLKAKYDRLSALSRAAEPKSEKWFDSQDGLTTVEALLACISESTFEFRSGWFSRVLLRKTKPLPKDAIIDDLTQMKGVLEAAKQYGVRFHLSIDI